MAFTLDRFNRIYDILDRASPREISFLNYSTPFQLVIAVILSARTTDLQVNAITEELFIRFPNPQALADADPNEIEQLIHPVGFFHQKSGYIRETAAELSKKPIPETMEELLRLPGVGRKSANVILGALFGKPAVIVDTHFARVAYRLGWTSHIRPERIEKELKDLIPPQKQYRISMIVNLLGREHCFSRNPGCNKCPVAAHCPRFTSPPA